MQYGFRLTKYISNVDDLIHALPPSEVENTDKDLEFFTSVLGVKWNVARDLFCFTCDLEIPDFVTRRQMLSVVSSIYDPLGLLSPATVRGKMLLQEAVRMKLPWDQPVPLELFCEWKKWLNCMNQVGELCVERCIKPWEESECALELHHFSDASEKAFGSCSYLRCVSRAGHLSAHLVMSKGKVAPIKKMTIPRLELEAAV